MAARDAADQLALALERQARISGQDLQKPIMVTGILMHLIQRMLDRNPRTRATIDAVQRHPWLTDEV